MRTTVFTTNQATFDVQRAQPGTGGRATAVAIRPQGVPSPKVPALDPENGTSVHAHKASSESAA